MESVQDKVSLQKSQSFGNGVTSSRDLEPRKPTRLDPECLCSPNQRTMMTNTLIGEGPRLEP
jgi:hypothetical protein